MLSTCHLRLVTLDRERERGPDLSSLMKSCATTSSLVFEIILIEGLFSNKKINGLSLAQ
jgi:hypothetical protein